MTLLECIVEHFHDVRKGLRLPPQAFYFPFIIRIIGIILCIIGLFT